MADDLLLLTSGGTDNLLLTSNDDLLLASSTSANNAAAECASFTFVAQAATVTSSSNVSAECATFTFAAEDATVLALDAGVANPQTATFTFAALSPDRNANAECASVTLAAQTASPHTVNGDHRKHTWQVRVEREGVLLGTIVSAVPGRYTTRAGFEFGEFEFTCSVFDPDLAAFLPYGDEMVAHEIALYEDGVLRWKGRPSPWDARLEDQTVTIRSRTFEHDFDRRFFGWAERLNVLENGSFEYFDLGTSNPPTNWLTSGVTCTRTDAIAEGTYAVELTASGTGAYLYQQDPDAFDFIEFSPGITVVATAWGKITSGTVEAGQVLAELLAEGSPGLFTEQFVADEAIVEGGMFRMAIDMFASSGQDWTAELRLYGINGTIVWDDAEIVFGDSTTVAFNGGDGEDLARLVENVTEYSQTSPWSDLIIGHDCPDTGSLVLRGWEHEHHEFISSAYRTLIDEYGCDIWIGLDRLLHLRNKRGNRRPELAITIDADDPSTLGVLADYMVSGDPSQASNVAIVTGESHLFAADEAGAQDTSKHGGLSLAKWERAPVSFQPLDLSHRADEIVRKEGSAPALPDLLILMDDDHGHPTQIVEVGDVIPVTISYGWIQLDADYRVTMVDTDPYTRVQRVTVDLDDGRYMDSDKCASFRVAANDAAVTVS